MDGRLNQQRFFRHSQKILSTVMLFFFIVPLYSQVYPIIKQTRKTNDSLYAQQQQDLEAWYSGQKDSVSLSIYHYRSSASSNLFSISSSFNLPYETLATLNRWDTPVLFPSDELLMVPNLPGIFLPKTPETSWEKTLAQNRINKTGVDVVLIDNDGRKSDMVFYAGSRFTTQERIRFLASLFSSPIRSARITSPFGYRADPFTGQTSFHPGIDLETNIGTPVLAGRNGKIIDIGTLEIYGKYIIIQHDGDYKTVYAHLNKPMVKLGQSVKTGEQIALSGNSGISTGPHLHFEIRRKDKPVDPKPLTAIKN